MENDGGAIVSAAQSPIWPVYVCCVWGNTQEMDTNPMLNLKVQQQWTFGVRLHAAGNITVWRASVPPHTIYPSPHTNQPTTV